MFYPKDNKSSEDAREKWGWCVFFKSVSEIFVINDAQISVVIVGNPKLLTCVQSQLVKLLGLWLHTAQNLTKTGFSLSYNKAVLTNNKLANYVYAAGTWSENS